MPENNGDARFWTGLVLGERHFLHFSSWPPVVWTFDLPLTGPLVGTVAIEEILTIPSYSELYHSSQAACYRLLYQLPSQIPSTDWVTKFPMNKDLNLKGYAER